jgi:hypothetical protein
MQSYGSQGGGVYRRGSIDRGAGQSRWRISAGWALLCIAGIAGLCASCSGGNAGASALTAGHDGLPAAAGAQPDSLLAAGAKLAACQGDFALYLLPETAPLVQDAGAISLSVCAQGAEVVVTATTTGAQDLRGICAELVYPRERYNPANARCGVVLGSADEQVSLCVTDTPGVASLGAVLKNYPRRSGVNGAGELAQVRFTRQACVGVRCISRAPDWDAAQARLALDVTNARLEWECLLPGDYNQDGRVWFGDLAALASTWGHAVTTAPYAYPDPRARLFAFGPDALMDSNHNGIVDVRDYYYLGYHWNEMIQEYWVYHSPDPAVDMPGGNAAPSKIPRAGRAYLASRQRDTATGRYNMSIPIIDPTPGDAYWVRPADGMNEGTPSNYAWYDTSLKDAFKLKVEPVTFLNGGSASFQQIVYTQSEDILVALQALDVENLTYFSLDVTFDSDLYDYIYNTDVFYTIPPTPNYSRGVISETYRTFNCALYSYDGDIPITFSGALYDIMVCHFLKHPQNFEYTHLPWHNGVRHIPGEYIPLMTFDQGSGMLTWLYAGAGDYSQDGKTLMDDLIVLTHYFGISTPDDPNDVRSLVDGNMDFRVNIGDINQISNHYTAITTGYFIFATTDASEAPITSPKGTPVIAPIGYVPFSAAQGNPLAERLRFSANIGTQPSGTYIWVMPEFNGQIGYTRGGCCVQVP